MGVDYVLFDKLVEFSTRYRPEGRSLMLGRQKFQIQTAYRKLYEKSLSQNEIASRRFDFLQDDAYSEKLFDMLGLGPMETMDFSDYEGASIIHDLNKPVPQELHGQFDFIFDGGTIEHVFNVPTALMNVYDMLAPGGRFISANGMNGWPGHGIYQFNPELVWTFWQRNCGCKVHVCQGVRKNPQEDLKPLVFPDPAEKGVRLKFKGVMPTGRVYLYYEIEKTTSSDVAGVVLQSDYETKWSGHDNAGATSRDLNEGVRT
jgi:SAM-dependent methyltransferase